MKFLIIVALAAVSTVSALPVAEPTHKPGGLHPLALNDSHLLAALAHVQTDLNVRLNSPLFHKIGRVLTAESQVVSGVKYHVSFEFDPTNCEKEKVLKDATLLSTCTLSTPVQICHATIHSQPWLNHIETTDFQCHLKPVTFEAEESLEESVDSTDKPVIAGGKHPIDVNDASLRATLNSVTPSVNGLIKSDQYYRIGKVLSAESQVVSGVIYHVRFELGETQCLKEKVTKDTAVETECNEFKHVQLCDAKIWSQPWLHHLEVSEIKCALKVAAAPVAEFYESAPQVITGGKHPMDVNDPELRKTVDSVESQLNERLNSVYYTRIGKILEAESQVVSGVMYHVKFQAAESKCLKSRVTKDTVVAVECAVVDGAAHAQTCTGKIWSQPWLHHLELTDVHCEA